MNEIDPRLKKLSITLINSLRKSEIKKPTDKDTVLNLWPSLTLKEVLENPLFYEQPITQPLLMTSDEFLHSLKSKNVAQEIIDSISLVNVDYRGFNDEIYHGQVVIHKDLVSSITRIFKKILLETDFPMTSVLPISMFNWNSSSKLNNCGTFDWRFVRNSDEISDHTFGAAIDINPVLNPWVRKDLPNYLNHHYDPNKKGTLHANSDVVKIFKEEGWKWGGDWKSSKDRMHFYRPEIPYKYYGKVEVEE
ncbi:M15 family metallopeptidase [Nanoarchaeota archaeon]